jgi:hypothetical protein
VLANDDGIGAALTLSAVAAAANGTAVIQGGKVLYTPGAGYVGADGFTYTITSANGLSATGSVGVTVSPVAPVVGADTATVSQGGSVLIDVLANDSGTGLALTLVSVGAAANGAAVIQNGRVLYTPGTGYSGADGFSYVVTSANGLSSTGAVAVTVTPVAPTAGADTATAPQGGSVLIDVLANDDGTGAALTLSAVAAAANGVAVIENGKVRYTPNAAYIGADGFTYTVTSANGLSATSEVAVTVTLVAPVANADTVSLVQDHTALFDVLANDVGSGITLTSVTSSGADAPQYGTAIIQDGKVLYTPVAGYIGPDAFTYTITGQTGLTSTGSVNVAVVSAVVAPTAGADTATTLQGQSVLIDVLANDTGLGLSIAAVGAAPNGAAVIENGKIRYTPGVGYSGADGFSYSILSTNGLTATGAVTVAVTPVAPVAGADTATVPQGGSVLIDVLANDNGTGAALTLTSVTAPANGAAVIQNGRVLYTPGTGYVGADGFSYTMTSANGLSATGAVGLSVSPVAPVIGAVTATVPTGGSVLVDVLSHDSGTGLPLTLTGVAAGAHGAAVIENGQIRYTPSAGYFGADGFSYTVVSANGLSSTGAVGVTVALPPPVLAADAATVVVGGTVVIDVLANDAGTGLTLTGIGAPLHGVATIVGGKISYTANTDFVGPDPFAYTVTDAAGQTASSTASVAITLPAAATNLAPAVFSPTLIAPENAGALAIGISPPIDPATPVDGFTITLTGLPGDGVVTTSDGRSVAVNQALTLMQLATLLFTPTPGVFGQSSTLTYTVADPAGNVSTGHATLDVGPALGAPVLSQPVVTVTPGSGPTPLGIGAAVDPNFGGDQLSIIVQGLPTNGALTLADGTALVGPGQVLSQAQLGGLLFTPGAGFVSAPSGLVYTVVDPAGNSTLGVVAIRVGLPSPLTAAPTLAFKPSNGGAPITQAITNDAAPLFVGAGPAGSRIILSGLGQAGGVSTGSFSIAAPLPTPDVTGLQVVETAQATQLGVTSLPSGAVNLLVLPPADGGGVIQTDLSSLDIATRLNQGYSLQFTPGVEAIKLTDGVLSIGADTNEAYIQRLYVGLLGRPADASGMTNWDQKLAQSASKADVAAGFLASPEFNQALLGNPAAFIGALYAGLLGRAASAGEIAFWTGPGPQSLGNAGIVQQIADSAEAKAAHAFETSKVFSRDPTGTLLHDIYETALGREAELGGLANYTSMLLQGYSIDAVARIISVQPEWVLHHAGQTDAQYVADLYQNGFGRTPSAADVAAGVSQLQSGATRAQVMLDVARRPETVARWTSDTMGQPPVLSAATTVSVHENQGINVQFSAFDPDRTGVVYSLVSGPAGAGVDAGTGLFSMVSGAAPSRSVVTVAATDPTGLVARQSFTVNVLATPPALGASIPAAVAGVGAVVSLTSSAVTAGGTVGSWLVNWGDGTAVTPATGAVAAADHVYATPGTYQVNATAITAGYGTFAAPAATVIVAPDTLFATSVTTEATGLHARFNGVLDPATLTLPSDSTGAPPTVLVTDALGRVIAGSLVQDPDGAGFRFIAASGVLANGSYRLVVAGGVKDLRGRALDGNADGAAGDDLLVNLSVRNGPDAISAPAMMRGPGQAASVPGIGAGLPVTFTSDGTATSVVFTAAFDPRLLSITAAAAGAGLPARATIGFATSTFSDGRTQATITVTSPTAIAAGAITLATLAAQVPASAAYGAKQVISLDIVSVNGVAQALPESSGLQVVGYLGDATGEGVYSSADAARILRVVGGADSGFAAWRGVAPGVVADANGEGALTAADAALIATPAALPAIPAGITLSMASNTPFVSAPTTLAAAPGDTVTVPVAIDRSTVLSGGTIQLSYDPAALTLTAVRADPASGLTVNAGAAQDGRVSVTFTQTGGAASTSGVLALFDFQLSGTLALGTNLVLDLYSVSIDGSALSAVPGADGADGRIHVRRSTVRAPLDLSIAAASSALAIAAPAVNPTRAAQAALLGGTAA